MKTIIKYYTTTPPFFSLSSHFIILLIREKGRRYDRPMCSTLFYIPVRVSGYKWGLYSGFTFTALAKASDDISRDLVQKLALFFALFVEIS